MKMPRPTIGNPTLEHYIYYLRRGAGDDDEAIQEYRKTLQEELQLLLGHLERRVGQTMPEWEWPEESEDWSTSQRILRTGWLKNAGANRSYFAAARTYGDLYWVQVGYSKEGEAEPQIFASLKDEMWRPTASSARHRVGESVYLCGIAASEMDESAAQGMAAYIGDAPGALVSTCLTDRHSQLYGCPDDAPHILTFLYPDAETETWASEIVNDLALRYELYRHAATYQLSWCEKNYSTLSGQENLLRDLLREMNQTAPSNPKPLKHILQLYRVFNDNLGMLVDRQRSIGVNLENLDFVLGQLGPLGEDRLLSFIQTRLQQRQRQVKANLQRSDIRQHVDTAISTARTMLGLDQLLELLAEKEEGSHDRALIRWRGVPGILSQSDTEPSLPSVSAPPRMPLPDSMKNFISHVYPGYTHVMVEKEFAGGFSGAQVFLVSPIIDDVPAARKVTKIGPAHELRQELYNYERYVRQFLPFCTARVERDEYYEQGKQAGLNYCFVGDGMLGEVVDLKQYYREHTTEQIIRTLDDLLDRELKQHWYKHTTPLSCYFAAEYGEHIIEHLRLKLHKAWKEGSSRPEFTGYPYVAIDSIPLMCEGEENNDYGAIKPGALVTVDGLSIVRIRDGVIKLRDSLDLKDPNNHGIVVRVEFDTSDESVQALKPGDRIGVCGDVIYTRRSRLKEILHGAFPDLSESNDKCIQFPDVEGRWPNPLFAYLSLLDRTLKGKASYVHGDLHLGNVLVDEYGRGRLIDFAKVAKRHILFDFIKLETYIRLMELAGAPSAFSMNDYVLFERALAGETLGEQKKITRPRNDDLETAYHVILAIRRIARNCMADDTDFVEEYLPALFLYCLAVTKYYNERDPKPTQLALTTASVLGGYLPGIKDWPCLAAQPGKDVGKPSAPQLPLGTGNHWAVLVGVNEYEDTMNYGRLHVCVKDAHAIREQLAISGFDPAHIRLLADDAAELPTRDNILATLKAVANATEPDDLLLFYYSGHGDHDGGQPYLIARNGRQLAMGDTAVSIARVKEIMEKSPARAKVIILDACHSGADIGGKGPKPMSSEFIHRVFEKAEGLAILASCKQGELSYEWQARERSVFTHFLLEALAGQADRDEKGFVTIQDANRHVTHSVKLWASQRNTGQTPTLQCAMAGDIILVRHS